MKNMFIKPRKLRLDLSTICQLKCPGCPTALGKTDKNIGTGYVKFKDFKTIIKKYPWVSSIELSNWGEIFLNKDLLDIIKYAHRHNVELHVSNGANLNNVSDEVLEALAKYRVRMITCSIDGACQETYSQYRKNGNFDTVIANIKKINAFKAKYHTEFPRLNWQFVALNHNIDEIVQARRYAADLNMTFFLKFSWDDLYVDFKTVLDDPEALRKKSGLGVASREEFHEKYGKDFIARTVCSEMWLSPQVNFDGNLLGCSGNQEREYGNIVEGDLVQCLKSERMTYARGMLMGLNPARDDIPCVRCSFYQNMKKNQDWINDEDLGVLHVRTRFFIMLREKFLGEKRSQDLVRLIIQVQDFLKKINPWRKSDSQDVPEESSKKVQLSSQVHTLPLPLEPNDQEGWQPYPIFDGKTSMVKDLSCHASVLSKDRSPHLIHVHPAEELLLLLSGGLDVIYPDTDNPGENKRVHLNAGQFLFYPYNFPHTIQATSEDPANYLMFKWNAQPNVRRAQLDFHIYDMFEHANSAKIEEGFTLKVLIDGPTVCLSKLQCHTSMLLSGAGYEPHADPYDVAIFVLEGEVETLGKRLGKNSVIFYRAGEPHGMCNPGAVTAKYIVFEFHR